MEDFLLSVHVLAAIVLVGGSAIATSLFPRYVPVAAGVPAAPAAEDAYAGPPEPPGERNRAVAVALHRVTRGYGIVGIVVPLAGLALAGMQGRMGEIWITVSIVLTAAAGLLLALLIAPRQRAALDEPDDGARLRGLSMTSGIYNLLWAVVVVLMIIRPGSAT